MLREFRFSGEFLNLGQKEFSKGDKCFVFEYVFNVYEFIKNN